MSEQYYRDALKSGQKEYRACVSRGDYPYLSVLEDILPVERIAAGMDLGVIQIPAERIVGTRSRGRTEAFARNFMPLLDEKTEFAAKWRQLCLAHLEEGIREPIQVYEYLNRYYVQEGNKRVSVLRFFDAVNIPARVLRILPENNADTELYFEYLAFNRVSRVNFIEFTKKGSYAALQKLLGKGEEESWTEEERRRFSADYYYFCRAFEANGGKKLRVAVGDAMLACMRVYGYDTLRSMNGLQMKKAVARIWEEMELQRETDPIEVKTEPAADTKNGLLSQLPQILPAVTGKKLKVAFLHDKSPETSGWTLGHELGRLFVQRTIEGKLETFSRMNVLDQDPYQVIEEVIKEGAEVVFTTSPRMLTATLRAAVEHAEVSLLNCSLNTSHRYIRTYYARMYEAKYIIGAIAGAMSQSGRVGYICDYPIYGQIAGINAFALGVQMVKPKAKVYLEWSSVCGKEEAVRRLTERNIGLISLQDMSRLANGKRNAFGLSRFTPEGTIPLVNPVWEWGIYYEKILRSVLDGSFRREYANSTKAINYYFGISAGVVSLEYSENVPISVQKLGRNLREGIHAGAILPFLGPLVRQDGKQVGCGQEGLSVEEIAGMDYLVENVIGRIPTYAELGPIGRDTVDAVGFALSREAEKV